MNEVKASCTSRVERVVMWCPMTYNWLTRGRRRCKTVIDNQLTQGAVNTFKKNLWLTKFRYQPNHWAYRDFKKMCYERICLIEDANKDF